MLPRLANSSRFSTQRIHQSRENNIAMRRYDNSKGDWTTTVGSSVEGRDANRGVRLRGSD